MSKNVREVRTGNVNKLYSYNSLVGYQRNDERPFVVLGYSVTTTRHVNQWLKKHGFDKDKCFKLQLHEMQLLDNAEE